jgi:hypothetical protein
MTLRRSRLLQSVLAYLLKRALLASAEEACARPQLEDFGKSHGRVV